MNAPPPEPPAAPSKPATRGRRKAPVETPAPAPVVPMPAASTTLVKLEPGRRRARALAAAAPAPEPVQTPAPAKASIVKVGQPLPLTNDEKRRLAEAVRIGEETRGQAEGALVSYGRWLLVNVFEDDSTEAIENKRSNPVWHALLDLADGPKLRLSRTSLHLAVQIAAYDKRLNDEAFRALDVTRKRMLLPLGDDRKIRDAAQHVSSVKLTAAATQAYVRAQLAQEGQTPILRMTPKAARARITRAAKPFTDKAVLGKWRSQLSELTGTPRQEALNELKAIAKAVADLMAALQKSGG